MSNRNSVLFFTFFMIFVYGKIYSQELYPQSLLWEVTGNNIKSASYLYGTIHIWDKRVFELNDSVISAILNSDIFAAEINFDSVNVELTNSLISNNYDRINLIEILSQEEIDSLNSVTKKMLGKSLKELNNLDARSVLYEFEKEEIQIDMPYPLDIFLYKIAKSNGKKIDALENLTEHLNLLLDTNKDELRDYLINIINDTSYVSFKLENLISKYLNANLTGISEYLKEWNVNNLDYRDKIFKKRNIAMAKKIDELVPNSSVFFAMGCGHLPGQDGLINLLQEKGYNVRPIFCDKTELVNTYLPDKIDLPWIKYVPAGGGFEVDIPGNPTPLGEQDQVASVITESAVYNDIIKKTAYVVSKSEYATSIRKKSIDSTFKAIVFALQDSDFKISKNEVNKNDQGEITGLELIGEYSDYSVKIKAYIRKKEFYLIECFYPNKLTTVVNDVDRFFNSFKLIEKDNDITQNKWEYFIDRAGAFKIKFPGKPLIQKIYSTNYPPNLNITFSAADDSSVIPYFLSYFESREDYPWQSEKQILESQIDSYTQGEKNKIIYTSDKYLDSLFYREFKLSDNEVIYKGRIFIRSNRYYSLYSGYKLGESDSLNTEDFFNSFQFLPYEQTSWVTQNGFDDEITIALPETLSLEIDTTNDYNLEFSSIDKNSGIIYKLNRMKFSDFFEADSSFFKDQYSYTDEDKEIILDTIYTDDNLIVNDVILKRENNFNYLRLKQILNGNILYSLSVCVSKPILYDRDRVETFFSSIKILMTNQNNIFSDKKNKFFTYLTSTDTNEVNEALEYSYEFDFRNSDLNMLYHFLKKDFYPYKDQEIKSCILQAFDEADASLDLDFFREYYFINEKNPQIQLKVLGVLSNTNNNSAKDLFRELFFFKPPLEDIIPYFPFYNFLNSNEEVAKFFPKILNLLEYECYHPIIFSFLQKAIDSSLIEPAILEKNAAEIIALSENYMTKRLNAIYSDNPWQFNNIVDDIPVILGALDNSKSKSLLKTLASDENIYLSSQAVISLIRLNEVVPEKNINSLLADKRTRNTFFESLQKFGYADRILDGKVDQELLAEGDLFLNLDDDGEEVDSLILIEKKIIEDQVYYLFKFHLAEDWKELFKTGISGPYPLNGLELVSRGEKTKTTLKRFDFYTIEEHWKDLLADESEIK